MPPLYYQRFWRPLGSIHVVLLCLAICSLGVFSAIHPEDAAPTNEHQYKDITCCGAGGRLGSASPWPFPEWNEGNVTNGCSWPSGPYAHILCTEGDPQRIVQIFFSTLLAPPNTTRLSGFIPPSLGNLTQLYVLALPYQNLGGDFPVGIAAIPTITRIDLRANQLTGILPTILSPTLVDIFLSENSMQGPIPSSWGSATSLREVRIARSGFAGEIPVGLYTLPNIQILSLWGNALTGTFPEVFSPTIEVLDLFGTRIRGSINPNILLPLTNLKFFDISSNNLAGSLPAVSSLVLEQYHVDNCMFNGSIPTSIFASPALRLVQIQYNQLEGTVSGPFPPSLVEVNMRDNRLTGAFPGELLSLPNLKNVYFSNNQFHGALPNVISSSLEKLSGDRNMLSGSLPTELLGSPNLRTLRLISNKLEGTLPTTFSPKLTELELSLNQLSGEVPQAIYAHPTLKSLKLAYNSLTGTLPQTISSSFTDLDLTGNYLTGAITQSFVSSAKLSSLLLGRNSLGCPLSQQTADALFAIPYMNLQFNSFDVIEDKICGSVATDPLRPYNEYQMIVPFLEELPSSLPQFEYTLEVFPFRLAYYGRYIYYFLADSTGRINEVDYVVWILSSIQGHSSYSFTTKIDGPFEKFSDIEYRLRVRWTDGTKGYITFEVQNAVTGKLKIGVQAFDPPADSSPDEMYNYISVFQFIKTPIMQNEGLPECTLNPNYLALFAQPDEEIVLADCKGTSANFTVLYQFDAETGLPVTVFRCSSRSFDVKLTWFINIIIDGQNGYLEGAGLAFFTNGRIQFGETRPPVGLPSVPIESQYFGNVFRFRFPKFRNSVIYDPDLQLLSLFSVEELAPGVKAAIAVSVLAVAGIVVVAILAVPSLRQTVFPFLKKKHDGNRELIGQSKSGELQAAQQELPQQSWTPTLASEMTIRNTNNP